MAIKDCIKEIRALAGKELTDDDIQAIAEDVQRRARAKQRRDKMLSDGEALDQAAKDFGSEADKVARVTARNKALNILARKRLQDFVETGVNGGLKAHEAIEALAVGINKKVPGARMSVDARQKAVTAELVGGMIGDLEKAGLWEFMSRRLGLLGRDKGVLDTDIARAMWSIGEDGKVTAKVSTEAKGIAEIVNKWQEVARLRTNRAGSFVGRAVNYIVRQSHDQTRIMRAGREAWVNFIRPLLDNEKTFGGNDPAEFLNSTYSALASGLHVKSQGSFTDLAFKGPANLAKKLSHERVLHFKDADAFLAYNNRFGTRSLTEAIFGGFERSSRDIALMETFGTNPRAMFDDLRAWAASKYRDEHPDWNQKINSARIDHQFSEIDGTTKIVDNPTLAQWGEGVRAIQSMAKLGFSMLSSFSDVPTAAAELRYQGENLGTAYTNLFANFLEGHSSGEQRILSANIGVGMEGALGHISSRFNAQDDAAGIASKTMRLFFKANLLSWWTDSVKVGAGKMMAWRAAEQARRSWPSLDSKFREAISGYGIDEAKWAVIRKGKQAALDGRSYLTPDGVRALPDEAFSGFGNNAARARDELSTALQAFYVDRTDFAVLTPGSRERALMHGGLHRGTWMGESMRFFWQFKSFPLTFATKAIGRDLGGLGLVQGLLKGRGDIQGLAHLIAATTAMGMISLQAKEILKGRTPRNPFSDSWPQVWASALTQGGGLGIYGDYLFGEFSRYGASPLETAAGPTFGTMADFLKVWSDLRTSQGRHALPADAIRFVRGNTPFANLFYTKLALDYLIFYNLQEMASPGYLKRSEQRLKRENDQTYIFRRIYTSQTGGLDDKLP
jgi:hypothetical protein